MTRFLVTGSAGQLGRSLVERIENDDEAVLVGAFSHEDLDISDAMAVARVFEQLPGGSPDVLLNAAAFTAVDRCEAYARKTREWLACWANILVSTIGANGSSLSPHECTFSKQQGWLAACCWFLTKNHWNPIV